MTRFVYWGVLSGVVALGAVAAPSWEPFSAPLGAL